jgi:hypothetical protein
MWEARDGASGAADDAVSTGSGLSAAESVGRNPPGIQTNGRRGYREDGSFEARGVALEAEAELARSVAAEARSAEASARTVAAAAHEAVRGFRGVGGFTDPGAVRVPSKGVHSEGRACTDTARDSIQTAGTCDRCLRPIDPAAHAETLARLVAEAERARKTHASAAETLRRADLEVARSANRVRENVKAASEAREVIRRNDARVVRNARDASARLESFRSRRANPVVAAAALTRLDAVIKAADPSMDLETKSETTPVPDDALDEGALDVLIAAAETAACEAERLVRVTEERRRDVRDFSLATSSSNPREMEVVSLKAQVATETLSLNERRKEAERAEVALSVCKRADIAFGARGIQSYLFEGALGELSARTGAYMDALTGGALTVELAPVALGFATVEKNERRTSSDGAEKISRDGENAIVSDDVYERVSPANARGGASNAFDPSEDRSGSVSDLFDSNGPGSSAEKIEKIIHAHAPDGSRVRRSLRQLSGGERRRVALALALAHADLASSRGGVFCDLLVLDEVLQHLDAEGIARVAAALRGLPRGTVLLTSQADSATAHLFDTVDRVWKRGGSSGVAAGTRGEGDGAGEEHAA